VEKDSPPAPVWRLRWRSAGAFTLAIWQLKHDSAPYWAYVGDAVIASSDPPPKTKLGPSPFF
jgi:hypothetical protein